MSVLPDILLDLVKQDGYSVGEAIVIHEGESCAYLDAAKGEHRYRVIAPDRYLAVVELMEQLG